MNVILALPLLAAWQAPAAPQVDGLVAVNVKFQEKSAAKVATTTLQLLQSCVHSSPSSKEEWRRARQKLHIHVKFPKPKTVTVKAFGKIRLEELLVTLPTNTGGIWVRSRETYTYYAKFDFRISEKLQPLLRDAVPARKVTK
jgi:hypothetical protein